MTTPNNDQFPQFPGNGAGAPNQFQNQYGGTDLNAEIVQAPKHSGLAIASLVIGIIGILISWIPGVGLGLPFIGLILAIVALVMAKKKLQKKGVAIAGLVLSILGFIIALVMTIFFGLIISEVSENCDPNSPDFDQCVQENTNSKFGVEN